MRPAQYSNSSPSISDTVKFCNRSVHAGCTCSAGSGRAAGPLIGIKNALISIRWHPIKPSSGEHCSEPISRNWGRTHRWRWPCYPLDRVWCCLSLFHGSNCRIYDTPCKTTPASINLFNAGGGFRFVIKDLISDNYDAFRDLRC